MKIKIGFNGTISNTLPPPHHHQGKEGKTKCSKWFTTKTLFCISPETALNLYFMYDTKQLYKVRFMDPLLNYHAETVWGCSEGKMA